MNVQSAMVAAMMLIATPCREKVSHPTRPVGTPRSEPVPGRPGQAVDQSSGQGAVRASEDASAGTRAPGRPSAIPGPVHDQHPGTPAGAPVKPLPEDADAEAMFRSGALLIEDNSGESLEGSRETLLAGVRRIEGALRKGPINEKKAIEALSRAYNALRSRAEATDEERQNFLDRERECYRRLTQLDAGNPEWQMAYSVSTTDSAVQLAELQVLARRYPRYIPGRRLLAERLCSEGKASEGMEHVIAAAESMSPGDVDSAGASLINVAWECTGEPGAEQVRRIIAARSDPEDPRK